MKQLFSFSIRAALPINFGTATIITVQKATVKITHFSHRFFRFSPIQIRRKSHKTREKDLLGISILSNLGVLESTASEI